jgi:hypothetical protein
VRAVQGRTAGRSKNAGLDPRGARHETVWIAFVGGLLAAALAWFGPPGTDLASHVYQSELFEEHGFALWNNFWYAGRYSFVTYSVLYYPLAALVGIKLLAVASVATAALAFGHVVGREWGSAARMANWTFAVAWAGVVLSGAYPFALGAAFCLLALWALQASRWGLFALLTALALAASPLAFLLLAVVLAGVALARLPHGRALWLPLATMAVAGAAEVLLWRLFPATGRYPYALVDFAGAVTFCVFGIALTLHVRQAHVLRSIYIVYLASCLAAFLVPSEVGENIARLRYLALPLAVLTLSLRRFRPVPVAAVALLLALSWNATPLVGSWTKAHSDPAADPAYWQPAIAFLRSRLTPDYRVEAVDTVGHWPAAYLPAADIPIARGWYRQSDFPRNTVLYDRLSPRAYLSWLRGLGVRYVVLTDAPPDWGARAEDALLRSGRSGLAVAFRSEHVTVFAVPNPRSMLTGAPGRVVRFGRERVVVDVRAAGHYRLAATWSPYWSSSRGCIGRARDGMVTISVRRPGRLILSFEMGAGRVLAALEGAARERCAR